MLAITISQLNNAVWAIVITIMILWVGLSVMLSIAFSKVEEKIDKLRDEIHAKNIQ